MSVFSPLFASLALKDDSARPPGVGHLRLTTKEWKVTLCLSLSYHVAGVRSDAVLDSLYPAVREDHGVLPGHHAPVTRLLLVEVQAVVVGDGVSVSVGTQGRITCRLSGRLSLALSGRPGGGPGWLLPLASDRVCGSCTEGLSREPLSCLGAANLQVLETITLYEVIID